MTRIAPFVRTRLVGGIAIVLIAGASLAALSSHGVGNVPVAGTSSRADVLKVEALGAETGAETLSAEVARSKAASVARSKAPGAGATNGGGPTAAHLPPSDQTDFVLRQRITGHVNPKSIVASGTGLVTAQNMYSHTISVFTPDGQLRGTVNDSVDLSRFGIVGHPGTSSGAPVEAAFTRDAKHLYVSNYSMSGQNFGPEGLDTCTPATAPDKSFLYRIDTTTLKIDQVIPVGAVPKFVAVTPDDSTVLVANWCSGTLSVVNTTSARLVATITVGGAYPRGIALSPDSKTAFVALLGSNQIEKVDLASKTESMFARTGDGPREILISPDGKFLYVTNSKSGTVSKVDTANGRVLATVSTGDTPLSMAISRDGLAVYVVNYQSSTVSKLRTSDLSQLARMATYNHPIGIAYEPTTASVWVASDGGSIMVFQDRKPPAL
jgi:YVTN family beta-propeller protein